MESLRQHPVLQALSRKPFAIVGHRCAAGEAVENTLSALRKALEAGVDLVEIDVQVTADGIPVVSHDENLKRVAGVDLDIRASSLEDVRKVELPGGEHVPTLEEFLEEACDKVPVFVEIKHPEDCGHIAKILERFVNCVAVISFYEEALEAMARLLPNIPRGLIYAKPPGKILEAKRLGCSIVLPKYPLATEKAVAFAHRLGLKVVAWTVNSEVIAANLVKRGVDAIATDYPSIMAKFRKLTAQPKPPSSPFSESRGHHSQGS